MQQTGCNQGGRFGVTDDSFAALAPEVEVCAEHVGALNATKTKESALETCKAHRVS